jgi:hypothetical protein
MPPLHVSLPEGCCFPPSRPARTRLTLPASSHRLSPSRLNLAMRRPRRKAGGNSNTRSIMQRQNPSTANPKTYRTPRGGTSRASSFLISACWCLKHEHLRQLTIVGCETPASGPGPKPKKRRQPIGGPRCLGGCSCYHLKCTSGQKQNHIYAHTTFQTWDEVVTTITSRCHSFLPPSNTRKGVMILGRDMHSGQ